jgi:hypothetical protein
LFFLRTGWLGWLVVKYIQGFLGIYQNIYKGLVKFSHP